MQTLHARVNMHIIKWKKKKKIKNTVTANFHSFPSHAYPSGSHPPFTVVLYLSLPVTRRDIWLLSSLVRLKGSRGGPPVCRGGVTDTAEMSPE